MANNKLERQSRALSICSKLGVTSVQTGEEALEFITSADGLEMILERMERRKICRRTGDDKPYPRRPLVGIGFFFSEEA